MKLTFPPTFVLEADSADALSAAGLVQAAAGLGLGTAATKNTGTTNGTIPVIGAGDVLPSSVLPPLAINDTFSVASQAAMLALTAQRGDIAIRSDLNEAFILSTDSPTTLADWKLLSFNAVTVNGHAGPSITLALSDFITGAVVSANSVVLPDPTRFYSGTVDATFMHAAWVQCELVQNRTGGGSTIRFNGITMTVDSGGTTSPLVVFKRTAEQTAPLLKNLHEDGTTVLSSLNADGGATFTGPIILNGVTIDDWSAFARLDEDNDFGSNLNVFIETITAPGVPSVSLTPTTSGSGPYGPSTDVSVAIYPRVLIKGAYHYGTPGTASITTDADNSSDIQFTWAPIAGVVDYLVVRSISGTDTSLIAAASFNDGGATWTGAPSDIPGIAATRVARIGSDGIQWPVTDSATYPAGSPGEGLTIIDTNGGGKTLKCYVNGAWQTIFTFA